MSYVDPMWPGCATRVLPDGGRAFELVDRELTWIRIDHQTRLQFGQAELVIETLFELRLEGRTHLLEPEDRAGLGPLVALYPATNIDATMSPDGTMQMTFVGGAFLSVPPHPQYEAWSLAGFWCPIGGFGSGIS